MKTKSLKIAVLGAGLAGSCAALDLAKKGYRVTLFDKELLPISTASLHNEGKLHLGYVYALDQEKRTHNKMIEGSLQFLNILEDLTGVRKDKFQRSTCFHYAVPKSSMLPFEKILDHFFEVDCEIENFVGNERKVPSDMAYFPVKVVKEVSTRNYNPELLDGVIQTPEFSVNPVQVSNLVSTAVLVNNNIDFRGNTKVQEVSITANSSYRLTLIEKDQLSNQDFDACINCLWEERIRFDEMLDIITARSPLTRYKATINFYQQKNGYRDIPSTTLVIGPFGDVVNYGNGNYYLSWYPSCKIGESITTDLTDLKNQVLGINKPDLIRNSIDSLARYLPSVIDFKKIADKAILGGGYICGWGKTDITDIDSGLHNRSAIGIEVFKHWISVNTGKYCTAPLYGKMASTKLIEIC